MGRRSAETFGKRQREKARLERQAAKRERREAARYEEPEDEGPDESALMERFRVLSERHAAGEMTAEAYESERAKIFEALGL